MKNTDLVDDGHCFACGEENPSGLRLLFRREGGKTVSEFVPLKVHQGFRDIVHGGIITAVLDEAMMKEVLSQGMSALTAEITVRFRRPLMVGERSLVEAGITKISGRLIEASAVLRKADGTVAAAAQAKLFKHV